MKKVDVPMYEADSGHRFTTAEECLKFEVHKALADYLYTRTDIGTLQSCENAAEGIVNSYVDIIEILKPLIDLVDGPKDSS